jgi:hypothetical protein
MTWVLAGGGRLLLAGGGRAWLWLLAGAAAVVLVVLLYRAERKLISRRAGLALLALRLAAAAVLVFALFEPIAAWSRQETVRGRVIVAADVSESMATVDPGRTDGLSRKDLARSLVAGEKAPLVALGADHDVKALAFARDTTPEGSLASLADRLKDARPGATDLGETDWSGAFASALKTPDEVPVLGVVLLTDGRKNASIDDAAMVDKLAARGVPIYPVLIGSTVPPVDLAVASLRAPESVYKGDVATIEATIKADGVAVGSSVDVSLSRPGEKPITQSVKVAKDGVRPIATFRIPLTAVGSVPITVAVNPPKADARADNNARSAVVQVADDKASVLLVDGEARWEFRYLRNALMRDPRVALDAVVFQQPPTTGTAEAAYPTTLPPRPSEPGAADPLNRFDMIVIGDVDLPSDVWARLDAYVGERGGTLAIIPGPRHWPAQASLSDASRALLPITDLRLVAPEPAEDPAHPSLPPGAIVMPASALLDDGSAWPMLRLGADATTSRDAWAGLPRLPWALSGRTKPGASALATSHEGDDSAVIAAMPYGLGKTLWVGTDSTWRWRYRVGDALHHRFWGQVVRWASSGKLGAGNRLVRFGPSATRARSGEGIKIQARIAETVPGVGPDFLVAARVLKTGSKEASAIVPLRPVPGRARLFEGIAPALSEGTYAIHLDAPALANAPGADAAGPIGEATLTVAPRETSERIELAASRDALDRLAAATGGRVFTIDDAASLPPLLQSKIQTTTRTEETPLWDHPAGLFLFFGIVGVEWILRKRLGLP